SAVDLTGREHEAALLGECDDVVQRAGGGLGHGETPGDGEGWNRPSIVTAAAVTMLGRFHPSPSPGVSPWPRPPPARWTTSSHSPRSAAACCRRVTRTAGENG